MLPQWHIAWRTDIDIYIPLSLLQELASGSYRSLNKHGLNLRALYKLESQGRHWQLSPSKDLRQGRRREREGRKCQFQTGALKTSSTGVWEHTCPSSDWERHLPPFTPSTVLGPLRVGGGAHSPGSGWSVLSLLIQRLTSCRNIPLGSPQITIFQFFRHP